MVVGSGSTLGSAMASGVARESGRSAALRSFLAIVCAVLRCLRYGSATEWLAI